MSITDYFKQPASTKKRSKKRKLMEDEEDDSLEPSVSVDTTSTTSTISKSSEPPAKRQKLMKNTDEAITEKKQESDDDDTEEQDKENKETPKETEKEQTKEIVKAKVNITYANCHMLLHESWREVLSEQFDLDYYKTLCKLLKKEQNKGIEIFPPLKMVFRAFEICPWNELKVVILGQDPYHDDNQAEGLCFSVQKGLKIPSSLRNMYKEATSDVGFQHPQHGSLVQWGEQGILLLNTVLTVQAHKANSHKKFGWQKFTDAVIKVISKKHDGVVFILWGAQAQKKMKIINNKKHKIIKSAHPSGLSAHRGFFQSKPYSKCNELLKAMNKEPINWQIDA